MFNDKKHCFHEFCDSSNVTYEHCNSVNDYEDHYNEMMKEEWLGDAVDDLCNPMTDSADNFVNAYCERSSRNNKTSRSSKPVSTQQMVAGEMTVGTMNNYSSNNYSSNNYSISNTARVFSNSKLFSYSKKQRIVDCIC